MVGGDGLSAAVKKETDAALNAHGLIKVRVFSDDRAAREAMCQTLADELSAAPIQSGFDMKLPVIVLEDAPFK